MAPGNGGICLFKSVENIRQEIRWNSFAGINNADLDSRVYPLQQDLNASSFRGKLDRVVEQIPENLLQSIWITGKRSVQRINGCLKVNTFCRRHAVHRLNRFSYNGWKI